MSHERMILTAIAEIGLQEFYDRLDEKIQAAVRKDRYEHDRDYDRLIAVVAREATTRR